MYILVLPLPKLRDFSLAQLLVIIPFLSLPPFYNHTEAIAYAKWVFFQTLFGVFPTYGNLFIEPYDEKKFLML